jgi:apolipoprotein N-acyltransferase
VKENFLIKKVLPFLLMGMLLALSFPPLPFYQLAFIAFVPFLYSIEMGVLPKRKYLLVYISFILYHYASNWWISSWQENSDPYLFWSGFAVALVNPLFFILPFIIFFFIRKRAGSGTAMWLFPFIWIIIEWARTLGDIAYPWLTIGYTQSYNPYYIQFADITGVWGISFAIIMINVIITQILIRIKFSDRSIYKAKRIFSIPGIKLRLGLLFAFILIPFIYGIVMFQKYDQPSVQDKKLKIGIIQPNINPWEKWKSSTLDQVYLHLRLQDSLIQTNKDLDLTLWSETSVHYINLNFNSRHDFSFLQDYINRSNVSLLTGFADIELLEKGKPLSPTAKKIGGKDETWYDSYNSALILNPQVNGYRDPQIYHKMKLTPFGETIPYIEIFSFLRPYLEWGVGISSWRKGGTQFNLTYDNHSTTADIGSIICIESIFPDFVRGFTDKGADMLVVITNDAWYDHTPGPEQHFCIAQMRAIENRRYIARCANTGVSGFITAAGRAYSRLEQYKSYAVADYVYLKKGKSIYVILGDWLPALSAILVGFFILKMLIYRKKS